MPWDGPEFARKHNKKLKGRKAAKAAAIADAMLARGVDEGEAIATANKRVKGFGAKRRTGKTKSWRGP